ncbi:MAG: sulfurtransferase complex subunit TusB [Methanomassiliicoccales archaeon]|nr:MAG: sulfurtransferase complex subunit TusB [Methanomassiliicoccales archaeon]
MPRILFTLLKSPFEKNEIHNMEIIAGSNEKCVILFEDAVYYATVKEIRENLLSKNYIIYAIKDELKARGYDAFSEEGVEKIDYEMAIELIMESYDKVVSM